MVLYSFLSLGFHHCASHCSGEMGNVRTGKWCFFQELMNLSLWVFNPSMYFKENLTEVFLIAHPIIKEKRAFIISLSYLSWEIGSFSKKQYGTEVKSTYSGARLPGFISGLPYLVLVKLVIFLCLGFLISHDF